MKHLATLAIALTASTALGSAVFAAGQPAAAPAAPMSAAQTSADHAAGKLSADGAQAFRDLHLARVAIFDADPTQAKSLIGKAQASLSKASTDETVFTKAEADLKPPASLSQTNAATAKTNTNGASNGTDKTQKIAWLPVDGQLSLGEDFVATPEKAAAVADANKKLATGDQKGAVEKLKLADIDVSYTMAVMPLAKTTADVNQAAQLIDQGKYYEANATLKQAEDGMRFDMVDAVGMPQKAQASDAKQPTTATSGPAASSTPAKPTH